MGEIRGQHRRFQTPPGRYREGGRNLRLHQPARCGELQGPKIFASATRVSFSEQSSAERPAGLVLRDNTAVDITIERGGTINTVI